LARRATLAIALPLAFYRRRQTGIFFVQFFLHMARIIDRRPPQLCMPVVTMKDPFSFCRRDREFYYAIVGGLAQTLPSFFKSTHVIILCDGEPFRGPMSNRDRFPFVRYAPRPLYWSLAAYSPPAIWHFPHPKLPCLAFDTSFFMTSLRPAYAQSADPFVFFQGPGNHAFSSTSSRLAQVY